MYYRVFGSHITLRLYPYLYAGAISISKKYILYNTARKELNKISLNFAKAKLIIIAIC